MKDISNDRQEKYVIDTPGRHVFLARNRNGELSFHVEHPDATLVVAGLYSLAGSDRILARHRITLSATGAAAKVIVAGILSERARLDHASRLVIARSARDACADVQHRHILLSKEAWAASRPEIEILNDTSRCSHASHTGRLHAGQLAYLRSRGIPEQEAERLLTTGTIRSMLEPVLREHAPKIIAAFSRTL